MAELPVRYGSTSHGEAGSDPRPVRQSPQLRSAILSRDLLGQTVLTATTSKHASLEGGRPALRSERSRQGRQARNRAAFNIQGGDRIWLKQMLKELETEGVLDRRRKSVHKAGQLPPVVLADIKGRTGTENSWPSPRSGTREEHGPVPTILLARRPASRGRAPVPGVGDRALVRVDAVKADDDRTGTRAASSRSSPSRPPQVLGIFRAAPGRRRPARPGRQEVPRTGISRSIPGTRARPRDGDLVAATVIRTSRAWACPRPRSASGSAP